MGTSGRVVYSRSTVKVLLIITIEEMIRICIAFQGPST